MGGVRCAAHCFHIPTLGAFLCAWINNIQDLVQWEPLGHVAEPLLQFTHFVQEYRETEVLAAPTLSWWGQNGPTLPPSKKKK